MFFTTSRRLAETCALPEVRSRSLPKIAERSAEMIEHVPRQERFFARIVVENGKFRGAPANPGTKARGVVRPKPGAEQRAAYSRQHIAHSASRHPGISSSVVTQRTSRFRDNRAAA